MHYAVLYAAVGLFGLIAYQDVRTRRIPNALSLAMAMLGFARIALAQDAASGSSTLGAGAAVFAVTLALFQYGIIGGGDAKLLPATTLVIGSRDLFGFLFLMSLCGGVLAIGTIIFKKLASSLKGLRALTSSPSSRQIHRLQIPPKAATVPYGFAVAVAGVMTLIASG